MNKEKLALDLFVLAAQMLLDKPVNKATVVVEDKHPFGCRCRKCKPVRPNAMPQRDFNREPDGVQINVDRPRRENYRSHRQWAEDMADYRVLIDQAKKCGRWPSKKPANIPAEVHANRRDWYEDNEPFNPADVFDFNAPAPWGW